MDPLLLTVQVLLVALGALGVAAAAPDVALEHVVRGGGALLLTLVIARVPSRVIVRGAPLAYVTTLVLLILVLLFGVAPEGLTARRWILLGPITVQPSELMKAAVIAYLAAFFHRHLGNWEIWRPMVVVGIAAGLVVIQPNVSTALLIFGLAFAMMAVAGTSMQRLVSMGTAAGVLAVVVGAPYLSRLTYLSDRINAFRDTLSGDVDVLGIGFQAERARAALSNAGFFGIGPGRPVRVPEAETDMIAVAIGQSLGLIGMAILVLAFVLWVGRTFQIANATRGPSALLAAGAGLYIGGQASLNLMVAAGLFPITGVPLPFVSYGLNSMVSVAIAAGFVHRAFVEARAQGAAL